MCSLFAEAEAFLLFTTCCHPVYGNGATVFISDLKALKTKIDTLVLRATELREIQLYLIHITPAPLLSRLNRPHDRMLCRMKVLRRMFIRRRIATPNMPADHAHPQMDPAPTNLQAFLTPSCRRLYIPNLIQMSALQLSHLSLHPNVTPHQSATKVKIRLCLSFEFRDRRERSQLNSVVGLGGAAVVYDAFGCLITERALNGKWSRQ
jgi:hypothetical protein